MTRFICDIVFSEVFNKIFLYAVEICQYSIWSSGRFLWVLSDDLKKQMHMGFLDYFRET